jgi:hypothetical protein
MTNNPKHKEKKFQSTQNHPKIHRDKQSIGPSNSTTRNLKQRNRHNCKNTQTAANICTWSTKLLRINKTLKKTTTEQEQYVTKVWQTTSSK